MEATVERRLLVHVTGDRIGDGLLKLPTLLALGALRPRWRVTWVTSTNPSVFQGAFAPLVGGIIDHILPQSGLGLRWFAPRPDLGADSFAAILATESRLKPALVLRRIAHGRFICPVLGFRLSGMAAPPDYAQLGVAARFRALCEQAVDATLEPVLDIPLSSELTAEALRRLPPGAHYLGLSPGAGGAPKRWPFARFLDVARQVRAWGATPVFFVGPQEQAMIADIRREVPDALLPEHDGAGDNGLAGPLLTIALARRLRLAVANDAGGGHLLAAGGHPVLTLYKSAHGAKFRSPYGRAIAISGDSYGAARVDSIPVDAVCARLRDVWQETAGAPA